MLAPIGGGCCLGRLSLTRRRTPTSRSPAPLHTETPAPLFVPVRTEAPVRARPPPHKTAGGSASRNGEARRECAGKAERSDRRAREDYGWGWVGGVTKPDQATRSATTHLTPAAARAHCADAQRASPPTTPHHTRGSLDGSATLSVDVLQNGDAGRSAWAEFGAVWVGGVVARICSR